MFVCLYILPHPRPVVGEFLEIMRQWESDRVRDNAAATGVNQSLTSLCLHQIPAAVLPRQSGRDGQLYFLFWRKVPDQ
jgi:hypothetical protein